MTNDRRDDQQPGDPAVDQAWRAATRDQPSAQLDATILAAARAATVRTKSASTTPATRQWWAHWQPLAAAAGVAGLAFTIVQMLPREADVPPAPSAEQAIEQARPGRSESAAQPGTAPAPPPVAREAGSELPMTVKPASPAASPSSQRSAGAGAQDAADAMADAWSEERLHQQAPRPATPTTPHDWARHIQTLFDAGERGAAADSLRAFRAAHPGADRYLTESLQPWAASVGERPDQAKEPAGITP